MESQIDERLYELVDLKKVILEFNSDKLQYLFGQQWHKILLEENAENPVEKVRLFITKICEKNNINNSLLEELIHTLLHTGQDAAALLMNQNVIDLVDLKRCDPRYGHIDCFSFGELNPKDELKVIDGRSSDSKSNAYLMRGKPRGFCFLLNNYFTKGTYKEMQRFRNIFHQLNFEVIMKKNLDAKDVFKELLLISKSDELKSQSAFIFMSISHGNSNGELIGFDGKTVKIENLVDLFNNANCPAMQRKPRMFFFNCCRGSNRDVGVSQSLSNPFFNIDPTTPRMSTTSDLFICYSTLEGLLAQVDWTTGTYFGRAVADSFVERANYKDLNAIIALANEKLEQICSQLQERNYKIVRQPIEVIQRANRQVFFH